MLGFSWHSPASFPWVGALLDAWLQLASAGFQLCSSGASLRYIFEHADASAPIFEFCGSLRDHIESLTHTVTEARPVGFPLRSLCGVFHIVCSSFFLSL